MNKYFEKNGELIKTTSKEINEEGFCAYCYENKWEVWNRNTTQWECRRCYPKELEELLLKREQFKDVNSP